MAAAQLRPVGDSETWRVRMTGARLPPAHAARARQQGAGAPGASQLGPVLASAAARLPHRAAQRPLAASSWPPTRCPHLCPAGRSPRRRPPTPWAAAGRRRRCPRRQSGAAAPHQSGSCGEQETPASEVSRQAAEAAARWAGRLPAPPASRCTMHPPSGPPRPFPPSTASLPPLPTQPCERCSLPSPGVELVEHAIQALVV